MHFRNNQKSLDTLFIKGIRKLFRFFEYLIIFITGKICGISFIIRYLRNPNPLITVRLLRRFGASIGERTTFKRTVFIDNSYEDKDSKGDFSNLIIGNNCYIGDCVYFDLAEKIIIQDNCVISGKVSFITHSDCNRSEYLNEIFPRKTSFILIEEGSWLGFGACILHGVKVGQKSVIGAYSLVNKEINPKSLNLGIPSTENRTF